MINGETLIMCQLQRPR